jgi:hypothetical protein
MRTDRSGLYRSIPDGISFRRWRGFGPISSADPRCGSSVTAVTTADMVQHALRLAAFLLWNMCRGLFALLSWIS